MECSNRGCMFYEIEDGKSYCKVRGYENKELISDNVCLHPEVGEIPVYEKASELEHISLS